MAVEPARDHTTRLTEALAAFARLLVSDYDVGDVLYELCAVAVDVTGTTGAGILLEDTDGRLRYAVASDPLTADLEAVQLEVGEGPCMLAHETGRPVLIPDLAAEERFPAMLPRTLEHGMRAVFTMPLLRHGSSVGILDLYRDEAGPLSEQEADNASLLADMATTAVLNRRSFDDSIDETERLQVALDARVVMEQAKGRVSVQAGVDVVRAEHLIHEFATTLGRPTGEVVRDIAAGRRVLSRQAGDTRRATG